MGCAQGMQWDVHRGNHGVFRPQHIVALAIFCMETLKVIYILFASCLSCPLEIEYKLFIRAA